MRIIMLTNTYAPHVGGVACSVKSLAAACRGQGHDVSVVAPEFAEETEDEPHVLRVPAIQHFNGSDFSVRLPVPGLLSTWLKDTPPEVVHSHHPFLLGDAALRLAASWDAPLVFTHHTMYERYTHYVPGDSPALARFVVDLSTGYANLCAMVFAPSESVAEMIRERGVTTPVEVVPTGIDTERFAAGSGRGVREKKRIPNDALVIGHVGRLAPEKNLPLLATAAATYLRSDPRCHFLVVGAGPSQKEIADVFDRHQVTDRLHMAGVQQGQELVDAYHAMDVFAFASTSETQGIVLAEAMACGVPVISLDAPGCREVVRDEHNGRLLDTPEPDAFVSALDWYATRSDAQRRQLSQAALKTAEDFSLPRCAGRALELYQTLLDRGGSRDGRDESAWDAARRRIEAEWNLWSLRAHAAGTALRDE
ncbi:MAG: glycosyltransferase [Pirellulales bacterium]